MPKNLIITTVCSMDRHYCSSGSSCSFSVGGWGRMQWRGLKQSFALNLILRSYLFSEADPVVPYYGPLILNPYTARIPPIRNHLKKRRPVVQSPSKKARENTRGPWKSLGYWPAPKARNARNVTWLQHLLAGLNILLRPPKPRSKLL